MLNKTSKLDAVNLLLSAINQSPVSSLSQTTVDVTRALQALDKASREVQTIGWKFNTLEDFTLALDTDKEIKVADNVLNIDLNIYRYSSTQIRVVLRGNRLFNLVTNDYKFTDPLVATVTLGLDWDELPEHARNYIALKARRSFQYDSQGSDSANSVESQDELLSYTRFVQLETRNRHANFLTSFLREYGWNGRN